MASPTDDKKGKKAAKPEAASAEKAKAAKPAAPSAEKPKAAKPGVGPVEKAKGKPAAAPTPDEAQAKAARKAAKKEAKKAAKKAAREARKAQAAVASAKPRPAAKPKAAPKPKTAPEKTIRITQIASPIGRQGYQRATLKGLGLNKLRRSRVLEDTPAVRGMVERVKHLLRIEATS